MKIQPLYNRILVKRYQKESVIHVPEGARQGSLKAAQGEIVAVGDSVVSLKVGDKIIWGKYSGAQIGSAKDNTIVMNDDDVLGVLEGGYIDE